MRRCDLCGSQLVPCPGKLHATGERSYVGFYPCQCEAAREEDAERAEWRGEEFADGYTVIASYPQADGTP